MKFQRTHVSNQLLGKLHKQAPFSKAAEKTQMPKCEAAGLAKVQTSRTANTYHRLNTTLLMGFRRQGGGGEEEPTSYSMN